MSNRLSLGAAALLALASSASTLFAQSPAPAVFSEVWVYVGTGEERYLTYELPVSDAAHFSASINSSGELAGVPDFKKLAVFKGRKHLVVAELGNYALTHFCLSPTFGLRDPLIEAIGAAAAPYDGVQIDFEAVLSKDRDAFIEFLVALKKRIGTRTLSVAVPARYKYVDEAYDYEKIGSVVDRIIVMAYDEHWSTSKPGPIASIEWCRNVASYAASKIGRAKLVMGLPFYGRAWADKQLSRAYKHEGVVRLMTEKANGQSTKSKDVPYLEYQETVTVQVYYEDASSILAKLKVYEDAKVSAVSFWRLGQEDPAVWGILRLYSR